MAPWPHAGRHLWSLPYDGELKAMQEHQQGSRRLRGRLDLDGNIDQVCLVNSWAIEVTQSAL